MTVYYIASPKEVSNPDDPAAYAKHAESVIESVEGLFVAGEGTAHPVSEGLDPRVSPMTEIPTLDRLLEFEAVSAVSAVARAPQARHEAQVVVSES